jgi:hypothetical protein
VKKNLEIKIDHKLVSEFWEKKRFLKKKKTTTTTTRTTRTRTKAHLERKASCVWLPHGTHCQRVRQFKKNDALECFHNDHSEQDSGGTILRKGRRKFDYFEQQ